jgi:hypothetical protein
VRLALWLIAAASVTAVSAAGASPSRWRLPAHPTWYWQLQGTVDNSRPATVYDIDGFENSAREVAKLHALGKRVVCYIDAGTWENFRPDAGRFPRSVLGKGNGWPGERWLDVRRLSVLEPIMAARFRICARKGFDAVEPDNIDGFANDTGFRITARQQLRFDEWLAREGHSLGLAVLQKNDPGQARRLEPYFDGVLDEQCNEYQECSSFGVYLAAGKPVLNAEYKRSLYPGFCAADQRAGIMGVLYGLALDGAVYRPC